MNDNEKAPVLTETLIETIQDLIVNTDHLENNSAYLRLQYENSPKDKQEAMDVFSVCLTGKTVKAILSINDARNKSNQNVG